MPEERWMNREQTAAYVGVRVDQLPRLVKAGKLPQPSLHFGPRSARYDRLALDALFTNGARSRRTMEEAVQDGVQEILRRANERNEQRAARRRLRHEPSIVADASRRRPPRE